MCNKKQVVFCCRQLCFPRCPGLINTGFVSSFQFVVSFLCLVLTLYPPISLPPSSLPPIHPTLPHTVLPSHSQSSSSPSPDIKWLSHWITGDNVQWQPSSVTMLAVLTFNFLMTFVETVWVVSRHRGLHLGPLVPLGWFHHVISSNYTVSLGHWRQSSPWSRGQHWWNVWRPIKSTLPPARLHIRHICRTSLVRELSGFFINTPNHLVWILRVMLPLSVPSGVRHVSALTVTALRALSAWVPSQIHT